MARRFFFFNFFKELENKEQNVNSKSLSVNDDFKWKHWKQSQGRGSGKVRRDQTPKALESHSHDSSDFILGAMGSHGRLRSDGGALPALWFRWISVALGCGESSRQGFEIHLHLWLLQALIASPHLTWWGLLSFLPSPQRTPVLQSLAPSATPQAALWGPHSSLLWPPQALTPKDYRCLVLAQSAPIWGSSSNQHRKDTGGHGYISVAYYQTWANEENISCVILGSALDLSELRAWRRPAHQAFIGQGSANIFFFCKKPENKYMRLDAPEGQLLRNV